MHNEGSFYKVNNSNLIEQKKKLLPKFIKAKGTQDLQYNKTDQEDIVKKIQELVEENALIRYQNKTLQLQSKKAIDLVIENRNAKILKYNSYIVKSPPKSKSRSPKSSPKNLYMKSRKSREAITTIKDSNKKNKDTDCGFYNSKMSILNTGGINSRLPSEKKSRNSNSFSADKNSLWRSHSLESMQQFKKKRTQNVFK